MSLADDADILRVAAEALGLSPSEDQLQALFDYLDLLVKWNRVYNLTAVRNPKEMLGRHLLDCLAAAQPLRREVGREAFRLLDVGSGGGLPGLPLAILLPEVNVTCVDSSAKKAAFVRQAAAELGVGNLTARHARVEALRAGGFDVIASRAFGSLATLVALTRSQLDQEGAWMAMKGFVPQRELAELPPDIAFHVERMNIPSVDAARCLVWMRTKG